MAKDYYDVLVFKIILYYYGVLKREIACTDVSLKQLLNTRIYLKNTSVMLFT